MSLVLGLGQPRRCAGLHKNYKGARLLQNINAPANQDQNTMPPGSIISRGTKGGKRAAALKEVDEDIFRLPDSSDEEYDPGHILPTDFRSASEKAEEQRQKDTAASKGMGKGKAINRNAAASTKSVRPHVPSASSQSKTSSKRKSQKYLKPLGQGMSDEFGRVKVKVNKKQRILRTSGVYGKTAFKVPPALTSDLDEDSPKKTFKVVPAFDSPQKSDAEECSGFKHPTLHFDDSPARTPKSGKNFHYPRLSETPDDGVKVRQPEFKKFDLDLDDSFESSEASRRDSSLSIPEKLQENTVEEELLATERPAFKLYDIDNLIGKSQALLSTQQLHLQFSSARSLEQDDEPAPMKQRAQCPMCGKPIDPADLRECGDMNTRQQERFCRSHQKKTAQEHWTLNGYPKIDWNKLDSRISKHHSFIKKLINGANSYYRGLLADTVNAGKNRTLMKSDFNPTPGYYGTRGLRAISENTMRMFTPLLKKRMVVDRVMAARGFTPYVEYVVVPEIAVLLIQEDMGVGVERAREIMAESLGVGQLLSEEIREVVTRRGSEEIEDSDG